MTTAKNQRKVLVVDNNPVILKLISSILEKEGCELRTAGDGLQALDSIHEFKPDIIFTDLVMPKIDGGKLCYIIRNTPELKHIFLVVISGIGLEEDLCYSDIDADVYIVKGPAATLHEHILAALDVYDEGKRGSRPALRGKTGLSSREITKELLSTIKHNEVILEKMTEGVLELNNEGRVVMMNRAAIDLFKCPEEKVLSRLFSGFLAGEQGHRIQEWIETLRPSALESYFVPYEDCTAIGDTLITVHLIPGVEEDKIFIVAILQDVTARKALDERRQQIEKELRRVQKLDAVSMMASGISHDFNNLLSVVSGNLELARIEAKGNPELLELLDDSRNALRTTTGLIRKFTTFSDNYLPSKSRVRIDSFFESALADHFHSSDVQVDFEVEPSLWPVDVDGEQIEQVFLNLIQNSVEAMDDRGTIVVRMRNVEGEKEQQETGHPLGPGRFVKISVSDQGSGMDEEIRNKAFDPYFSTKSKGARKGMGLGLTIVHAIVRKHGGLTWLDSEPGRGCTVHLYLPAGTWTDGLVYPEKNNLDRRRVLIMDDDEMMRIICKKIFSLLHCDVDLADEGGKAVDLFTEALNKGKGYDLVVLDLRVNFGMSGVEAAEKIWAIRPGTRMVVISGDSLDPVMENYRQYNFKAALPKPFTLDILEKLLKRLFDN